MEEEKIEKILKIITGLLREERVFWRLDGSANLLLQGVKTSVRDLDITTDKKGIKVFRSRLKSFIAEDFSQKEGGDKTLICYILGEEVEINSYRGGNFNARGKIKEINRRGIKIPVVPLEFAREFYKRIGRKEKVDIISKYLEKKRG